MAESLPSYGLLLIGTKASVVDFELGHRSKSTYLKLAQRIDERYKIKHLCNDDYSAYKYYTISDHHHTTKA